MSDRSDVFLLKRNIFYYLKNELLVDRYNLRDFSYDVRVENEIIPVTSSTQRKFIFSHSNIIHNIPAYSVIVRRNGFVIPSTEYVVNYGKMSNRANGYIEFTQSYINSNPFVKYNNAYVDIISVDYSYLDITIDFAFNDKTVTEDSLPIIAINFDQNETGSWEIGSSVKTKNRSVFFDIYAKNPNQLDNIISLFEADFDNREIPLVNYRYGEPLDDNGFINIDFSGAAFDGYTMSIMHISSNQLYPASPTNIDQYSAMIETNIFSLV
jgi:hypothetical protein